MKAVKKFRFKIGNSEDFLYISEDSYILDIREDETRYLLSFYNINQIKNILNDLDFNEDYINFIIKEIEKYLFKEKIDGELKNDNV